MGRRLAAASAIAIACAGGAAAFGANADPLEPQWLYEPKTPDGPAAIFLDWTYSSVILRVHCDRAAGELVFIAPDSTQYGPPYQMDFSVDEGRPINMRVKLYAQDAADATSTSSGAVVGRLKLTRKLLGSIVRASYIDIGAPNDMDEAWHVGRAEPLRRVARACPAK